MPIQQQPPPPHGENWKNWGERLNAFLIRTRDKLRYITNGETASENGILMWEENDKNPVVSLDGVWTPLGLGGGFNQGGHGMFFDTNDQTATAINTAYGITWGSTAYSKNVSINATDTTKIEFSKAGKYYISFHATASSSSASTKTLYFWPRVNGTDVSTSTIISTLHENTQKKVISRDGIFEFNAGDYLQAMWATDDITAWLDNNPATAFAPSTPAVTLAIVEVTT